MLLAYDIPLAVDERIGQTAHLRAVAAVGATSCQHLARTAVTAVAHAQGAMHERFERHVGGGMDFAYRIYAGLAGYYYLRHAAILKPARLCRVARVALGARVQLYRRTPHFKNAHILYYQCVDTGSVKFPQHFLHVVKFVVVNNCVDSDIDFYAERCGKFHEAPDILDGIACLGACPVARSAYVYGIGSVKYRLARYLSVARRSK